MDGVERVVQAFALYKDLFNGFQVFEGLGFFGEDT